MKSIELQDGDGVAVVGDSITHEGFYHRLVADVLALRGPGRGVRWVNCGISGDSAAGALARFDADIAPHRPTHAVVLFGMNDGNRGLYTRAAAGAEGNAAARAKAIRLHRENMAALVGRLRACGVRELVLLSPTVYDQYTRLAGSEEPCGYDDALAEMGAAARDLAVRTGSRFIDLHVGFLEALRAEGRPDGRTVYIREDRVHPTAAGQLLMAVLILEALGVPAGVGRVELDAAGGRCEWTCTAGALPCGAPGDAWAEAPASLREAWQPLNRDVLVVRGLDAGVYALSVDGQPVVEATAEQWAAGVDLAALPQAPQVRQAAEYGRLSEERRRYEVRHVRNPTAARMFLGWDRYAQRQRGVPVPDDDLATARQFVAAGEGNPYVLNLYQDFLDHGSPAARAEAAVQLAAMESALRAAARIPARCYSLTRSGEG